MNIDNQRAWSYSSLNLHELCRYKWYNQYINKKYKEKPNPNSPASQGHRTHEAFANYLAHDMPLPTGERRHQQFLDYLVLVATEERLVEQELALDRDMSPCGWSQWRDVWVRAKVDFTGINRSNAILIDHKTGRYNPDTSQLKLQVAVLAAHRPDLKTFTAMYYWTQDVKRREIHKLTPADMPAIWSAYMERVAAQQVLIDAKDFEPCLNFTCKSYCPVADCQHHGQGLYD